jgi:predicted Fe-Mo cluster-binding NifX family protein
MKVAIAVWEDCVSSVLDFSRRLVVMELENGRETSRTEIDLAEQTAFAKLAKLRDLGISVLICGAVSQPLASAAVSCGIRLLPYVTGRVDDVLKAYGTGQLSQPQFALPGWWPGARRGFRCRRCQHNGRRGRRRQERNPDMRRWGAPDEGAV